MRIVRMSACKSIFVCAVLLLEQHSSAAAAASLAQGYCAAGGQGQDTLYTKPFSLPEDQARLLGHEAGTETEKQWEKFAASQGYKTPFCSPKDGALIGIPNSDLYANMIMWANSRWHLTDWVPKVGKDSANGPGETKSKLSVAAQNKDTTPPRGKYVLFQRSKSSAAWAGGLTITVFRENQAACTDEVLETKHLNPGQSWLFDCASALSSEIGGVCYSSEFDVKASNNEVSSKTGVQCTKAEQQPTLF